MGRTHVRCQHWGRHLGMPSIWVVLGANPEGWDPQTVTNKASVFHAEWHTASFRPTPHCPPLRSQHVTPNPTGDRGGQTKTARAGFNTHPALPGVAPKSARLSGRCAGKTWDRRKRSVAEGTRGSGSTWRLTVCSSPHTSASRRPNEIYANTDFHKNVFFSANSIKLIQFPASPPWLGRRAVLISFISLVIFPKSFSLGSILLHLKLRMQMWVLRAPLSASNTPSRAPASPPPAAASSASHFPRSNVRLTGCQENWILLPICSQLNMFYLVPFHLFVVLFCADYFLSP